MPIADIINSLTGSFGIPRDWEPATPIGQFVKGSQGPQSELAMALMGGPRLPKLIPAMRYSRGPGGDQFFTGANHAEAFQDAVKKLGPKHDDVRFYQGFDEGFVTPEGQYLDRRAAAKLVNHPNVEMLDHAALNDLGLDSAPATKIWDPEMQTWVLPR